MVSSAALTMARGSIARKLSRSGARVHCSSGPPSEIGTAAPPLPTTTLDSRPGREAAANRAAEVPMSGPTMCGLPSPHTSTSPARNSPIACGDRMSSRRSDPPNPGRSTAKRRACCASEDQIGAKAYTLSGHGLVSRIDCSAGPGLSAQRILTPSTDRNPIRIVSCMASAPDGRGGGTASGLAASIAPVEPTGPHPWLAGPGDGANVATQSSGCS